MEENVRVGLAESLSAAARRRMRGLGEPMFLADWERALMIHYEVDGRALQEVVPFELDLREGRAYVSVVAFTMSGMRPRLGGRMGAWLFKPIATHGFLNIRTYVQHGGESGIFFLAEWLPNRLSVALGPRLFGLPYRLGKLEYEIVGTRWDAAALYDNGGGVRVRAGTNSEGDVRRWRVTDLMGEGEFECQVGMNEKRCFCECEAGSMDAWLMERYTAFTSMGAKDRFFRVWHSPWEQDSVDVQVMNQSLLQLNWPFFCDAKLAGANFSPGVRGVWMGRPRDVRRI